MPQNSSPRDFTRLFELIRQHDLADQIAAARHRVSVVDTADAAAFLARATRSLLRAS